MPDDVVNRLRRHLAPRTLTSINGFIVTAPDGGPSSYANWRNMVWAKLVDRFGIDLQTRDLRTASATRQLVTDRWTPPEVQAWLGHRDPRITLGLYAKVYSETLPQPSPLVADAEA